MSSQVVLGLCANVLSQHLDASTDVLPVNLSLKLSLSLFQFHKTPAFLILANVILKPGCRRARPLGILEDVKAVVSHLFDQSDCIAKICITLAGKPDNDITSYRNSTPGILNCTYSF